MFSVDAASPVVLQPCNVKPPLIPQLLQVASAATEPPAPFQTAIPAPKEEEDEEDEEDEDAAASAERKAEDGSQAAKRQKMSALESEDMQHVEQPVEEARKVAAATKDALGLNGNSFSLLRIVTYCQVKQVASRKYTAMVYTHVR